MQNRILQAFPLLNGVGMQCQRMYGCGEFFRQGAVDQAVSVQETFSREAIANQNHFEVAFRTCRTL